MQQNRKRTQNGKQAGEPQAPLQTRENATRAKAASGMHPKPSQDHVSIKPTPQQGQRLASYVKEAASSPALEFHPCALVGPDGQSRPGWELWVNGMMFGRADAKETLLAYHARLHDPLPSGHWKDRAWQPMKKRSTGKRSPEDQASRFDDEEPTIEPEVESSWNE